MAHLEDVQQTQKDMCHPNGLYDELEVAAVRLPVDEYHARAKIVPCIVVPDSIAEFTTEKSIPHLLEDRHGFQEGALGTVWPLLEYRERWNVLEVTNPLGRERRADCRIERILAPTLDHIDGADYDRQNSVSQFVTIDIVTLQHVEIIARKSQFWYTTVQGAATQYM